MNVIVQSLPYFIPALGAKLVEDQEPHDIRTARDGMLVFTDMGQLLKLVPKRRPPPISARCSISSRLGNMSKRSVRAQIVLISRLLAAILSAICIFLGFLAPYFGVTPFMHHFLTLAKSKSSYEHGRSANADKKTFHWGLYHRYDVQ